MVGAMLVLLLQPHGPDFWKAWFVTVLVYFAFGAAVTGLAKLFFTASQRGKSRQTFVIVVWAAVTLGLAGMWSQFWGPAKYLPLVVLFAAGLARWIKKTNAETKAQAQPSPTPVPIDPEFYQDRMKQ